MNEIQKYSALKLPWEQVSRYVGSMVSAILEQDITCTTKGEDDTGVLLQRIIVSQMWKSSGSSRL